MSCTQGQCVYFFFSSSRRHTSCGRDWSSDVCSSDLINISPPIMSWFRPRLDFGTSYNMLRDPNTLSFAQEGDTVGDQRIPRRMGNSQTTTEIGRASCRERVQNTGPGVAETRTN